MAGERVASAANILGTLIPTLIGSGKTTSTQSVNTQNLDNGTIASLQQLVSGGQYSKASAQNDAQGAMQNAIRLLLQQGTPEIASAQHASGIYNDTTTQLLSNDLTSRVAGETANIQLANVKNYADIQNTAANTLKGATQTGTVTETSKTGPAIDPLLSLGVLAGGTLLSHLFSGGFNTGKKRNNGLESPPTIGETQGFNGNVNNLLSSLITPNFGSIGGSNASGGKGAGSTAESIFSGATSSLGGLLGGLGTSLLSGLFGPSGNTSSSGATTGPSAGSAGDIGNQGSSISGGSNSIGGFFSSLLGSIFGF